MHDEIPLWIVGLEIGAVVAVLAGAIARRLYLQTRQADLAQAERALASAGFIVERRVEENAAHAQAPAPPPPLTCELVASADGARVRVERTRRAARCTIHIGNVKAVSRATFDIKRPAFGDGAYAVGAAWPKDRVAAFVAQPVVRAALERLFTRASVDDVSLVAHEQSGAIRVHASIPWSEMTSLHEVVDDARRLARALDEVMWLDVDEAQAKLLEAKLDGAVASSTSGAPFAVPVRR